MTGLSEPAFLWAAASVCFVPPRTANRPPATSHWDIFKTSAPSGPKLPGSGPQWRNKVSGNKNNNQTPNYFQAFTIGFYYLNQPRDDWRHLRIKEKKERRMFADWQQQKSLKKSLCYGLLCHGSISCFGCWFIGQPSTTIKCQVFLCCGSLSFRTSALGGSSNTMARGRLRRWWTLNLSGRFDLWRFHECVASSKCVYWCLPSAGST